MDYSIEAKYRNDGYTVVAGTDEAGRGPLCGPVVAAAVILPEGLDLDAELPGLNDSKKLTEKKRETLFDLITAKALAYGIAEATPAEIDEYNILNASQLAMRRAVAQLEPQPDLVLVDGNVARDFTMQTVTVVGGDAISPSIAAASILAKVTRDRILVTLDAEYPSLALAKHKGYPTKAHYAALNAYIDEFGAPPEIYRSSFLKKLHREA